jgi:hypothetical protein
MNHDPSQTPVVEKMISISLVGPDDVLNAVVRVLHDRLKQELQVSRWFECERWVVDDEIPPSHRFPTTVPSLSPLMTPLVRPVASPKTHNIRVAVANPKIAEIFAEYGLVSLHQLQNFTEDELLALPEISSNRLNPVKGAMRVAGLTLLNNCLPLKDRHLDEMPLGVLPWLKLNTEVVMGDLATSHTFQRICRDFRTMDLIFFAGLDAKRCRQLVVLKDRDGDLNGLLESFAQLAGAVLILRQALEIS